MKAFQSTFSFLNRESHHPKIFSRGENCFYTSPEGTLYCLGSNDMDSMGTKSTNVPKIHEFFKEKNLKIKKVYPSIYHTFFITTKNEVYCCGYNGYNNISVPWDHLCGQLGLNELTEYRTPVFQPFLTKLNPKQIITGIDFSVYLTTTNQLYGSGEACYLGTPNREEYIITPILLTFKFPSPIKRIRAGYEHTLVLLEDSSIFGVGYEEHSSESVALGIDKYVQTFTKISFFNNNVTYMNCGPQKSFFITKKKKKIYACGRNSFGSLGVGDKKTKITPTLVKSLVGTKIKKIYPSEFFTFFLSKNQELYLSGMIIGVGQNKKMQKYTCVPIKLNFFIGMKIRKIKCGSNSFLILNEKNQVFKGEAQRSNQLDYQCNDYKSKITLINEFEIIRKKRMLLNFFKIDPLLKYTDIRIKFKNM